MFTSHVQEALGIEADGYFGPQTKEAVISFQQASNIRNDDYYLEEDGIVGNRTKFAMYNNVQ